MHTSFVSPYVHDGERRSAWEYKSGGLFLFSMVMFLTVMIMNFLFLSEGDWSWGW